MGPIIKEPIQLYIKTDKGLEPIGISEKITIFDEAKNASIPEICPKIINFEKHYSFELKLTKISNLNFWKLIYGKKRFFKLNYWRLKLRWKQSNA